ncbi:hypothetical protein K438DRAFT_1780861 [Mycena galopus ATCC 62051]|nr:hypothetical protein K438DRAFT_1780861 [Mycena galopus ATCC 62051]
MSTSASVISSRPLPTLPTAVPVTVKRAAHVKRRNASPAAKIPEGYAFLPPPVPSYARGAQAYAQPDRVRGAHQHGGTDEEVLRTGRGRVGVKLQATVLRDAVGTWLAGYEGIVAGFGFTFEPGPFHQSGPEYGGEAGSPVGPPPHLWTSVDGSEAGSLVGKISSFFVSVNRADPFRYRPPQPVGSEVPWDTRYLVVVHGLAVTAIWRELTKCARSLQFCRQEVFSKLTKKRTTCITSSTLKYQIYQEEHSKKPPIVPARCSGIEIKHNGNTTKELIAMGPFSLPLWS